MTYVRSVWGMKTEDYQAQLQETEEKTSLADTVKEWEELAKTAIH
jgi:hypothetical protein